MELAEKQKTCTKCGETKPLDGFHKRKNSAQGRNAQCRACIAGYQRQRRNANPELFRGYASRSYAKNGAKAREARRRKRAADPEKALEYERAYRAANPDKFREYSDNHRGYRAQWRADNQDRIREANSEWYAANREHVAEYTRKQKEADPEKFRQKTREGNRRWYAKNVAREIDRYAARRVATEPTSWTTERIAEIRAEGVCTYCGANGNMTVDHIIPLHLDGQHVPGNLNAACQSCNSSKGAKPLKDWDGPPAEG